MAPQVCGILKKITGSGGKTGRGRMYLPFPSEGSNAIGGVPSATYQTDGDALGAYIANNITVGTGGNTVTLAFALDKPPYNSTTYKDILTCVTRDVWGTQRRRSFVNRGDQSPF